MVHYLGSVYCYYLSSDWTGLESNLLISSVDGWMAWQRVYNVIHEMATLCLFG